MGIAHAPRTFSHKISIERNNRTSLIKAVTWLEWFPKRLASTSVGIGAPNGIVLNPTRIRQGSQQLVELSSHGWRSDGWGEDAQSLPLQGSLDLHHRCKGVQEEIPGADRTGAQHGLWASRIIDLEDLSLSKEVRGPHTSRMVGVAFNLNRASIVALHRHT